VKPGDDAVVRDGDVAAAVRVLARSGIVAYPTETVYGLGVDARDAAAIAALLELKGRDEGRGISLLVTDLDMASTLLYGEPPEDAVALATRFWPGPLTIVLPAAESVADALRGPSGGVGLRCSSDAWATALVQRLGAPLTSTSANTSGAPPARSAAEVKVAFASHAGAAFTSRPNAATDHDAAPLFILDGGERRATEVSTVVEFSKGRATLRRRGAISADSIAAVIALAEEPRG
jgi:L-threonylcarbamoyladenylate synthase